MTETQSRKKKKVRFSTEIMFIVSVIFCVALSVTYLVRYNDIKHLLQREQELKEKVEGLERDNRQLKQQLETLSTPEGIERLARERLGLVRPGELVIYTVNDRKSSTASGSVINN